MHALQLQIHAGAVLGGGRGPLLQLQEIHAGVALGGGRVDQRVELADVAHLNREIFVPPCYNPRGVSTFSFLMEAMGWQASLPAGQQPHGSRRAGRRVQLAQRRARGRGVGLRRLMVHLPPSQRAPAVLLRRRGRTALHGNARLDYSFFLHFLIRVPLSHPLGGC